MAVKKFPDPLPVWKAQYSRANWERNKTLFAKLTKATGVGQALENVTRGSAAVKRDLAGKVPLDAGQATAAQIAELTKDLVVFQNFQQALQTLLTVATAAYAECRASKLISHQVGDFLKPIPDEAQAFLNDAKQTVTYWKAYLAENKAKAH